MLKALSKLKKCDLFSAPEYDLKVCKENLIMDGNFDNNMECYMAKEIGCIE